MAILGLTETQILIQQPGNIYSLVTAGPLKITVKYGRFVTGEFRTIAYCDYPLVSDLHDGYGWNLERLNKLCAFEPEHVTPPEIFPTESFFDNLEESASE